MLLSSCALVALLTGLVAGKVYFDERFDDPKVLDTNWKVPKTPLLNKENQEIPLGKWEISSGKTPVDEKLCQGLCTTEDSRYYEITSKLTHSFNTEDKDLVLQFSVKHEQAIECGGGYIKLLDSKIDPDKFNGDTPYLLMFGPDICGPQRRVHVIWSHNGKNYLIKKEIPPPSDHLTHLYTLIVRPDQTYEVHIDQEKVAYGSLEEDWEILPPKKIADPTAKKPADWVDESEIDDPEDEKPENWDAIQPKIVDPDAKKPAEWDDELDGEWKAPLITNPDYKGPWKARRIKNPKYKGPWTAPLIANPDYHKDETLYILKDIGYVGFDLWQVKSGTIFDNILLTDNIEHAKKLGDELWSKLSKEERERKEEQDRKQQEQMEKEREKFEAAQAKAQKEQSKEHPEEQTKDTKIGTDADADADNEESSTGREEL